MSIHQMVQTEWHLQVICFKVVTGNWLIHFGLKTGADDGYCYFFSYSCVENSGFIRIAERLHQSAPHSAIHHGIHQQWFIARLQHSLADIICNDTAQFCAVHCQGGVTHSDLCALAGTFRWSAGGRTKSKHHYARRIFITSIRAAISAHRPTDRSFALVCCEINVTFRENNIDLNNVISGTWTTYMVDWLIDVRFNVGVRSSGLCSQRPDIAGSCLVTKKTKTAVADLL